MLLTFGILSLFVGGVLLALSLPRVLTSRTPGATSPPYGAKLLTVGFILLCAAVFMIHEGRTKAEEGIDLGILLFFGGLVVLVIGIWLGFWGPVSNRNTTRGLQFILLGLFIMLMGILALSDAKIPALATNDGFSRSRSRLNLDDAFSRRMGPIRFGAFCIAVFIGTNGAALMNRISAGKLLGVNLVVIAFLLITYALGPSLFASW